MSKYSKYTNAELNNLIKNKENSLPRYHGTMLVAQLQKNIRDIQNEKNSRKPKGWSSYLPWRRGGKTRRRRSRSRSRRMQRTRRR
jgi:hypothetical protein